MLEGWFVRFVDKFEMLIQVFEYEFVGVLGFDEFWNVFENFRSSEFYGYFKDIVDGFEDMRK